MGSIISSEKPQSTEEDKNLLEGQSASSTGVSQPKPMTAPAAEKSGWWPFNSASQTGGKKSKKNKKKGSKKRKTVSSKKK